MKSQNMQNMASTLGISVTNAQNIMSAFISELRAQMRDINSPAWKACMQGGKWRTPQNMYCKKTYWNGCTPETGATKCVPRK